MEDTSLLQQQPSLGRGLFIACGVVILSAELNIAMMGPFFPAWASHRDFRVSPLKIGVIFGMYTFFHALWLMSVVAAPRIASVRLQH